MLVILGKFVSHFGISEYQQCISDVSTVYQYSRTFAFLIRLYQIQYVSGMYHMCISSVSVAWAPPTLIQLYQGVSGVYQECISEGVFFYTLIHS